MKYKGMNVLTTIWRKGTDDYSIEQVVVWRGNGDRVNEELAFRNNRYYMPSGMYYKIRYNRLDAYDSDGFILLVGETTRLTDSKGGQIGLVAYGKQED